MIRFGSAQAALVALPDLATRGGGAFRAAPEAAIKREISEAKALRARHVFLDDVDYPALLAEIDNSPAVIMVMGDIALEAAK